MSKYIDTDIINYNTIGGNIDGDDLVFYTDEEKNIYSGGFNVNSIIMKAGLSPFSTLNKINNQTGVNNQTGGNVSDLFEGLVVPNWLLSQENKFNGGFNAKNKNSDSDDDDDDDDVITDDIHNNLLKLVTFNDNKNKHKKTKRNKNNKKNDKKNTKKNI
jgi:hypothetical protein